jgi:DnaJ-class molecular chaperone
MYDPYSVLGLPRTAGEDEVKQAFRTLAKRFHPDTPEGASDKGRRFKDLSIAYEILGDAKKRRAYDRGEIDAHGNPRPGYVPRAEEEVVEAEPVFDLGGATVAEEPPKAKNGSSNGNGHAKTNGNGAAQGDSASSAFRNAFERAFGGGAGAPPPKNNSRVEDLFSEFFGERNGQAKRTPPGKAPDNHFELQITFEEAMLGGTRRVKLPDGKRFDVRIPIGVRDGQTVRLKGHGEAAYASNPPGDALIKITIEPHPYFRRDGHDILLNLPITLGEALHGGKISVPTLHGPVTMSIPPRTNAGQVLRLKGKGVPAHSVHAAGDQLVTLQIVLPEGADDNLSEIVKRWETANPYDPRSKLGTR